MKGGEGEILHVAFGDASGKGNRLKEPEAREIYLTLGSARSIRKVREHFGARSVSERSLEAWSSKYEWSRLAHEHDMAVIEATASRLRDQDARAMYSRANIFEQLADACALQALHGVRSLDSVNLKPRDLLHLMEVAEKSEKFAMLLESRAYLEPSPKNAHLIKRLISESTDELSATVDWLRRRAAA